MLAKNICPICGKVLTRSTILRDHIRSHEGTRPFSCKTCGRSFTRAWDLTTHAKTHSSTAAKFVCGGTRDDGSIWGCKAEFRRKRDLIRHQRRKKGSKCQPLPRLQVPDEPNSTKLNKPGTAQSSHILVNAQSSTDPNPERFACPFTKCSSEDRAFGTADDWVCSIRSWPDVKSLASHLLAFHWLSLVCSSCSSKLYGRAIQGQLGRWSRQCSDCKAANFFNETRLYYEILRCRDGKSSGPQAWYRLFESLFSGWIPSSPYLENRHAKVDHKVIDLTASDVEDQQTMPHNTRTPVSKVSDLDSLASAAAQLPLMVQDRPTELNSKSPWADWWDLHGMGWDLLLPQDLDSASVRSHRPNEQQGLIMPASPDWVRGEHTCQLAPRIYCIACHGRKTANFW